MAVPSAYLNTVKNTASIFAAMQRAGVPDRFTFEFLKQLGFGSSSDRPTIAVLKSLGFLDDSSAPTERYRSYKDPAIAKAVLAQGMRDAYADVFAVDTEAHKKSATDLAGIFSRLSNKGEAVNAKMATTFRTLASLADFSSSAAVQTVVAPEEPAPIVAPPVNGHNANESSSSMGVLALRHDIHVHLPLSTDVAVYDAIFKSLKANLQ
jgi:Family of unknown function (DUF5343)